MRWPILSFVLCLLPLALRAQEDPAETARFARIAAIAAELRSEAADGAALFTEAARLCGFTIWSEDRRPLAEPLAPTRLHLALTDAEIRAFVRMDRDGHSVALSDLLAAIDVLWRGMGVEASCEPFVTPWRQKAFRAGAPATRGLFALLQALGAQRGEHGCIDRDGDVELDPLQALLLTRVLTEDILLPLRRVLETTPADGGRERPRGPAPADESTAPTDGTGSLDWPGWAEDGFVGTVTSIVGKGIENIDSISKTAGEWAKKVGGGEKLAKGVGYANAVSAVVKCIATYTFLVGEVRVDAPGQPLVRTKAGPAESDAGEQRTLVARFWIDGTRVTDWMKENRPLVALAGLDIDMPKTGALKGIETEWDIREDRHSSKHHLIKTVRGQGDISKVETDEQGEARIRVEGRPQPKDIQKLPCLPVEKKVPIVVTPQVKSTEAQQDLVDAVLGAIGVLGGPEGWITPVIECLYRMKWKGGRNFTLQVRDWQPADVVATAEVTLKASGSDFHRDHGMQMSLDRSLRFSGVHMGTTEFDLPPLDETMMKFLPASVREQMLEGRRQMERMAQSPFFQSQQQGEIVFRVRDRASRYGDDGECESKPFDETTTWTADLAADFADPAASPRMFTVQMDRAKQTATLSLHLIADCKVHTQRRSRGGSTQREVDDTIDVFADLELQPPFDRGLVLPLKEVPNAVTGGIDTYGVASVPFRFGPSGRFQGTAIVTYTISRRPKPANR